MKKIQALPSLILLAFLLIFSNISIAQIYCAPTFANGCSTWNTQSISLNTINWTSSATCTMWDFTATSTSLAAGSTTPMSVTNGSYCGCSVWVDFNSDGDFNDAGENLYGLYTANATNTYNFSIIIPAATPNGLYRMRVISSWGSDGVSVGPNGYGGCGAFQYGNYQDFTLNIGGVVPCAPTSGLNATAITSSTATVSWNVVAGVSVYEYVIDNVATNPIVPGTTTAATSYNAVSLSPASVYYLHVRSYCGGNVYSTWSTYAFTTLAAPCVAPTGLNATAITSSSASLSWNAVAGASGYEYVVDNNAANPAGAGTATVATSYNATPLTPASVYYLHVRTNCGGAANFSTWATYAFTTLPAPCVAPTGLAANSITSNSAVIAWTAAAGALAYEYVVSTNATQPAGNGTTITNSPYVATPLTPATIYYAFVRSYCGGGGYSPWTYAVFTTLGPNAVNEIENQQVKLIASPNPVLNQLYIAISNQQGEAQMELIDIYGKVISNTKVPSATFKIDMSSLSSGLYLLHYQDAKNSKTLKVNKN